jgi:hypothetical protein
VLLLATAPPSANFGSDPTALTVQAHQTGACPMSAVIQLYPAQDQELAALTVRAREAADGARAALLLDDRQARLEKYLAYGHALLPIKAKFPKDDRGFSKHIKQHGVEASTTGFRADAMWLAREWDQGLCLQNFVDTTSEAGNVQLRQITEDLRNLSMTDKLTASHRVGSRQRDQAGYFGYR